MYVIGFILSLLLVFFQAFTFSNLFNWFAAPTFHLQPIGIAMALGLTILIRMVTWDVFVTREKVDYPTRLFVGYMIVGTTLLLGWLLTLVQ